MRTVVLGEPPTELAAMIERRRALGQDGYDEIWQGEYHMAPAPRKLHGLVLDRLVAVLRPRVDAAGLAGGGPFNLGSSEDYRVPDYGYHRSVADATYVPTAAVVVEVVSPDDETYDKFGFYAAHGVDELIVADPQQRTVRCYQRRDDGTGYDEAAASALLLVNADDLTREIDWPAG